MSPKPGTDNILGYVNRELDKTLPNVKSAQYVYERVITFLVGRKYAQEAVLLYQRMREAGLMPSAVSPTPYASPHAHLY